MGTLSNPPMTSLGIIISLLPLLVHAQNVTSGDNDTKKVGWVSGPDGRGTSDILWSCFAIFLVCTWKCTHLNIPSQEESDAGWHKAAGWLPYWPTRPWWSAFLRKVKWMLFIAIAPEFGVGIAVNELWQARELKKSVNCANFTITHSFYALMGGFVIAIPPENETENQATEPQGSGASHRALAADRTPLADGASLADKRHNSPPLSLEKLQYYSIMGKNQGESADATEKYKSVHPVVASNILPFIAQASGSFPCFPVVTETYVSNQSKSDPFTKAFAVLQCAWLIIQSIARTSQSLRLTELELTTLAFTICAFLMYGFWWYKPFDAQQATPILCLDRDTAKQIRPELEPWSPAARSQNIDMHMVLQLFIGFLMPGATNDNGRPAVLQSVTFHTAAIAFSGIHLIAWNWDFPSPRIQVLWRAFSIFATCGPLAFVPVVIIWMFCGAAFEVLVGKDNDTTHDYLIPPLGFVIFLLYAASRLGLIVLIFYCFSAMPASVYQAPDWNLVFPHFS